jgi:hypothetical protein
MALPAPKTSRPSSIARKYPGATVCKRKFLHIFPEGFYDEQYLEWERDYKWKAHQRWQKSLNRESYQRRLDSRHFRTIADEVVRIESRTNLLFSFEKMALRDAVRAPSGARMFAEGLYDFVYGTGSQQTRFERWCGVVGNLPRKQTRVLTWPVATVFGFIAKPERHVFLKPNVTRHAAELYGFPLEYQSRPAWPPYASLLEFANVIWADLQDLRPRDLVDIQSFIWVQGSDEYA